MSENIVEIRNLSRRFGDQAALDDVSMSIPRGLVCGLVGENGAGKTTLIKHIMGLLKAKSGTVRVFGLNPIDDPVGVLGRIGYLSEDRDLPDWMRVIELMRYTQAFYPTWDERYAEELRETFELDPRKSVKSLSQGQRARMGLLIALAHRPDLLVLDEPSSGLDPIVRRDILSAIIQTVADEGRTILFSSHLLDEVERVSDSIAMIHQGKLVLHDTLEAIRENHCRFVLRFPKGVEQQPRLPGAISCKGMGREWTVICNGAREQLLVEAKKAGGVIVDERSPSLDEIFVARIKG